MNAPHDFLVTFAVVLCAAAVTTVLFERFKQPVVLGYLLAGMLIGPHISLLPIVADAETTEIMAELGVILLLFAIGLEFSIRKLLRVGGSAMVTAVIDLSLMSWLGFTAGRLLGFSPQEAVFAGAVTAISSTTIIAKVFEDLAVGKRLKELVFGVLIVEDLAAVLILAALATLGGGDEAGSVLMMGGRLFALLSVWVIAGLLIIPRLMRFVVRLGRPETTLVASLGLCFAFALLALNLGYSVALGAFIAGSLIAESGKSKAVIDLVRPVRDIFAAVFFVAVGMLIDPVVVIENWLPVLVLTLVVVFGKIIAVSSGAFLAGQGTQTAIRAGMSMAQIGEFSFIIATLGLASGLVSEFFYPVVVAVSAITTLTTPYLVRFADSAVAGFDRRLPKPLQTYATLYATWVEDLARVSAEGQRTGRIRKMLRWLLIDALAVLAVTVGVNRFAPRVIEELSATLSISASAARVITIAAAILGAAPFLFGIGRMARGIAKEAARLALPKVGRLDLAAAPRRALVVSFEVAIVALVGLPMLAISQPFLSGAPGLALLLVVLAGLSFLAWRSVQDLEGHVSAGTEVLISALRSSLPPEQTTMEHQVPDSESETDLRMATATHLLPGLGNPVRLTVESGFACVGRSLKELALRGNTGATVLAITREGQGIPAPIAMEPLQANDQLVLVGSSRAIELARVLLRDEAQRAKNDF